MSVSFFDFALEAVAFATRPLRTLFCVSCGFAVFRFRTVFGFEVSDRVVFIKVASAARSSSLFNKALAFPVFLARGDVGVCNSDRTLATLSNNLEGGVNEGGGEGLSGATPKRRAGVHGDTDRAQFCSGDDDGITIASRFEVMFDNDLSLAVVSISFVYTKLWLFSETYFLIKQMDASL